MRGRRTILEDVGGDANQVFYPIVLCQSGEGSTYVARVSNWKFSSRVIECAQASEGLFGGCLLQGGRERSLRQGEQARVFA